MDRLILKCEGDTSVTFHSLQRAYDGSIDYFSVSILNPSLNATLQINHHPAVVDDPSCLFDSMALEWKGWKTTKDWESLEGDLVMVANSDNTGHVELSVNLNCRITPCWKAEVILELEAGQLESFARQARDFFNDSED